MVRHSVVADDVLAPGIWILGGQLEARFAEEQGILVLAVDPGQLAGHDENLRYVIVRVFTLRPIGGKAALSGGPR